MNCLIFEGSANVDLCFGRDLILIIKLFVIHISQAI